jgi:hypothetical protein
MWSPHHPCSTAGSGMALRKRSEGRVVGEPQTKLDLKIAFVCAYEFCFCLCSRRGVLFEQAPAAPRPAAARGRDDAWHTVSALEDFGARRAAASRSCSPSRTWRSNQRKSATRRRSVFPS